MGGIYINFLFLRAFFLDFSVPRNDHHFPAVSEVYGTVITLQRLIQYSSRNISVVP